MGRGGRPCTRRQARQPPAPQPAWGVLSLLWARMHGECVHVPGRRPCRQRASAGARGPRVPGRFPVGGEQHEGPNPSSASGDRLDLPVPRFSHRKMGIMPAPISPVRVELVNSCLGWRVLYTCLHVDKPVCVFLKLHVYKLLQLKSRFPVGFIFFNWEGDV